ncbi:MAG: benzoate MFS transporter BenK [uncultured Paraburkholderia sp.]|nr:MAG: benzoate MFS transporter BenK [uncultured Paraburkholderia sp.]
MRKINVHRFCEDARFTRLHAIVLSLCTLVIIFDGYDLAVAGIALPSIMAEMGIKATSAGFMVSSALFCMMFGAVFFGTIADRVGRRWTIAACVLLFSMFTAAAGYAKDPVTFGVFRFIAGLGIGGVMPNVVAQMSEYSPRRIRSTMVTLMFSGYSIGGMLAALVGKGMIERFGWQSVFIAAGLPVLVIPFVFWLMPESMAFLVRSGRTQALQAILAHLVPAHEPKHDDRFVLSDDEAAGSAAIGKLFQNGRALGTVMLWTAFFMCLFMVYALSSWLTKLMAGAGYTLGSALTFVLVLDFGAMIGAIAGGWLADRFNINRVLASMYALAAVSISLLGMYLPTWALFIVVGLAGASTIGTQILTYAYAGQFYPSSIRSTGIGWASGVGRSGAILGPIIIGILVEMALPLSLNFVAIALPAVVATIAVLVMNRSRSDESAPGQAGAQLEIGAVTALPAAGER